MEYIKAKHKKTGTVGMIMKSEFNSDWEEIKEEKSAPETKENKAAPKRQTKAKTITSDSINEAKD